MSTIDEVFTKTFLKHKVNRPKLIDLMLGPRGFECRHGKPDLIRSGLLQAKRFTFDENASRFIGELMRLHGKEILAAHEWARPPYPTIWAELDHRAYYVDGLKMPDVDPETADTHFGMLIHQGHAYPAYVARNGKGYTRPFTAWWDYAIHQPSSFEHELEMAQFFGTSRLMYSEALLGGVTHLDDPWWKTTGKEITRSHRMEIDPPVMKAVAATTRAESRGRLLAQSAGDLKIVLAMLLLLTRPHRNMAIREEGHRRMLYKGHPLVVRDHSLITMHLIDRDPVKRYIEHLPTGIRVTPHDVRGHWCESRIIGRDCPVKLATGRHDFQPISLDRYKCDACDAKRWWHKEHIAPEPTAEYDVRK